MIGDDQTAVSAGSLLAEALFIDNGNRPPFFQQVICCKPTNDTTADDDDTLQFVIPAPSPLKVYFRESVGEKIWTDPKQVLFLK